MKYLPNLLPPHSKTDLPPDILSGKATSASGVVKVDAQKALAQVSNVFGIIFLATGAIRMLSYFPVGALSVMIGTILIPKSRRWYEQQLRFKYTVGLRTITLIALGLTMGMVGAAHQEQEEKIAAQKKVIRQQEEAKAAQDKQTRLDSVEMLMKVAQKDNQEHKYSKAIESYTKALSIQHEYKQAFVERAGVFASLKAFDRALADYDSALTLKQDSDVFFRKGVCYALMDDKRRAVYFLNEAINLGHKGASAYNDKINPIKRVITGYHRVCCDGTTSYSSGRGTCSHHGGVCGEQAEYTETREY